MAAIEQPPTVNRIPRSRSARLADQAATAALYVTHPERRLTLREPLSKGIDISSEDLISNFKATGSRPGFSHASAVAALSHAKARELESDRQAAAAIYVQDYPFEGNERKAFASGVRDRRSVTSNPSSGDVRFDLSSTDLDSGARREMTVREKAISAARGALYGSRKRADSDPSEAYALASEEPFDDLDSAMEASRIQHIANTNARLSTASPPTSPELQEQRRRSVIQAAAISMSRDMYGSTESKGGIELGAALPAAQIGLDRARSQRSTSKPDTTALQHAIAVQEIAQKRAAEKLASMQDETLIYREYYGVEPQITRSTISGRKRRGSIESDTSTFDVERSKEIRHQMTSLRTQLDAVDEQRERDRDLLLEAAKKNVDATMRDMELRVCEQTGRAPPSVQKQWEEAALARAQRNMTDMEAERALDDKVNLGLHKYMDMADVEAVARSRLQPTFDEITNRAETERAKVLEERLDEEERERHLAVERQRDAEMKAEEKRAKAAASKQLKAKEGKSWLWRKKSKRTKDHAHHTEDEYSTAHAAEEAETEPGVAAETVPRATADAPTTEVNNEAIASGAVATEAAPMEAVARTDSKLKTFFGRLSGRRSSAEGTAVDETTRAVEEQPTAEASAMEAGTAGTAGAADKAGQGPSLGAETAAGEATEDERTAAAVDETTTHSAGDGDRAAALTSHPITANDLHGMQRRSVDGDMTIGLGSKQNKPTQEGSSDGSENGEWSRLKSKFSKIVSKGSGEQQTNGITHFDKETQRGNLPIEHIAADDLAGQSREDLRDSAADQGLPVPPVIGKGKRASVATGRESRFSEDL
ncbi:hypothetical protein FE257_011936 [Aspergillus nanangensis]|uniref:Eisosome protein 1 n=1 Tax=Aspergillus nanangensis TaxID=2582783 RepID=A0AAD4GSB2_ASPNN|nr:hypothetical protein FE257_011936 [Aspergillus nanangensis]